MLPRLYNGKDRTFWFFSYEGFRLISPATRGFFVPTEAMRNGDFSGLMDAQGRRYTLYDPWTTDPQTWARQPFPGNRIPASRQSPLAKYLLSVTPLPTHPDTNPLVEANWWGPVPDFRRQWTVTTRVDHSFSEKDRL